MEKLKLSIIISASNAEANLRKCLDNLIKQSYKNIEVIVVNNSPKYNCDKIVGEYSKIDNRICYVNHNNDNKLFSAKVSGALKASGDYIAFLDSDNYVSCDFYRTLMVNAQKNNSDIVIGNTVLEYDDGRQIKYNLFDFKFESLKSEEGIKEYFRQEGLIFSWYTICNKIYKKSIWDKAVEHYKNQSKKIIITEDFAFSTVLFYYANLITKVENDAIFYRKHDDSSLEITLKKIEKNIENLVNSFNFVEEFLKEVNIYNKYKDNLENWKILYCNKQKEHIEMLDVSDEEKQTILKKLEDFCKSNRKIENANFFQSITTPWNTGLEQIKQAICDENIKCVSFDIFDTLVVRPFFTPSDIFILLNNTFRNVSGIETGVDFYKMRTESEKIARKKSYGLNNEKIEVTLDEIYTSMEEVYHIEKSILEEMKKKEIEYETRFCMQRKTAYELYELALAMGKKVICISDMYLPNEVIKNILDKNDYTNINKIYVSSETKIMKREQGKLYQHVLEKEGLNACELLHIGDNYNPDCEIPQSLGINTKYFPRTVNVFWDENMTKGLSSAFRNHLPDWQDNVAGMRFIGIRCMLAVVANCYFDNPYRSFLAESDFNADPFLVGYYALGMYLFGIINWIINDITKKNYDSIVFMARDGFLPLKAYQIMKEYYKLPKEKYLYISRKSLIPITILNKTDLYKLSEIINVEKHTPQDIVKYLNDSVNISKEELEKLCTNNKIDINKNFEGIYEFNKFIGELAEKFFNKEKHEKKLRILKEYFSNIYEGKSCTFDIGYSGRPEMFLSKFCEKPIDTYFININQDEALCYSHLAGYELNTFFDYKPTVTGNINEFILSALAPSCIGYNVTENGVEPVFEEYKENYAEANIIEKMQDAALKFLSDMMNIFGQDIKELYYQKYYVSLPLAMYIHSSSPMDQNILAGIVFEDDIRLKEKINSVDLWRESLENANQHKIKELTDFLVYVPTTVYKDVIVYKNVIENYSKPLRAIYYLLYDREHLKKVFKQKISKISGKCQNILRRIF